MNPPTKGRCSKLPSLWACPSSWLPPEKPLPDVMGEPAKLGVVVHVGLAELGRKDRDMEAAFEAMSESKYWGDVDHDEATKLLETGLLAIQEINPMWCSVEKPLNGGNLEGHVDLAAVAKVKKLILVDYKSGWVDMDYSPQMKGYALCEWRLRDRHPEFEVDTHIVWLRFHMIDRETYTAEDMRTFEREYEEKLDLIGKIETPGPHCGFCKRGHECPTYQTWLKGGAMIVMGGSGMLESREDFIRASDYVAPLEKALETFKKRRKAFVEANGPLNFGDGYELAIIKSHKETVDPLAGWDVLSGELSPEELADCMNVVKKKLESAIKAKAERGKKTAKWKEVRDALYEAGALRKREISSLRRVKRQEIEDD